MLQPNHQFSFPETYFGSLTDLTYVEDSESNEEERIAAPWILVYEPEIAPQLQQQTGLFINWENYF